MLPKVVDAILLKRTRCEEVGMLKKMLQFDRLYSDIRRNACLFISILVLAAGCSVTVDRATIVSFLFTSEHEEVPFDETQSIGFHATNGYWQLDLKRLVGDDSIYQVRLVDSYSRPFEFTLHDLAMCMQDSCYPGCIRKGLFKGVQMRAADEVLKKRVNFSCECLVFDSEGALVNFLSAPWHNTRSRKLLSPEGLLICVDSSRRDTTHEVIVEVMQLLVGEKSPSLELLKPYLCGTFRWQNPESNLHHFFMNIHALEY